MAYTALPHAPLSSSDHRRPDNLTSASPALPDFNFEDLAATLSYADEPATTSPSKRSVTDVLKSLTGSQRSAYSYEVIEDDDYELSQITPKNQKTMATMMEDGYTRQASSREDIPTRTASISRHLPLHNPTPDLQSLQGAYVKNVERLEDSAERLSLAGSIEEGLQRMKMDIRRSESMSKNGQQPSTAHNRRFSSNNSTTNSIIGVNAAARSGGYSPAAYVTSPIGSLRSQRKISQKAARMSRQSNFSNPLPEPEQEGRPLESAMVHSPPTHAVQPRHSSDSQRPSSSRTSDYEYDRPGTSASNDTYRQAQSLFTDFDGIHFSPDDDTTPRRISLSHPPLAKDGKAYKEAQPGEKMVYYPAPVPVMLNLPKRLSKANWAQQEQRRHKALSTIPSEMRKSAVWLANEDMEAELDLDRLARRSSNLPAQLRASAFFDAPGTQANVKLKHGSAVITLDSILDAAAHAPVSAFTDHPIAGHLGNEVYGQEPGHQKKSSEIRARRKSSLSNLLGARRKSSGTMEGIRRGSQHFDNEIDMPEDDPERAAERSIAPGEDEFSDEEKQEGATDEEHEAEEEEQEPEPEPQHKLGFLGAPTTLLAELQMRKAQQKLRNRTAANAFPKGMHSTLLELDAVSQLQQKSRKQKHVALAWEDQEEVDRQNHEDEDVPLGLLFPEKERQTHVNLSRPMGLMEKKELEENEPLSFRRARLRGEQYLPPIPPQPEYLQDPASAAKIPGVEVEEDEVEGETLGQRRKRIQQEKEAAAQTNGPSLADDIASQLGIDSEEIGGTKTPEPEVEETLGQRRKRLQAEAERPALKAKTSMGDLLRANPVGNRNGERLASAESKVALLMNRRDPSMPLVGHIQAAQPGSKALPSTERVAQVTAAHTTPSGQPLVGTGLQGTEVPHYWPGRSQAPAPRPELAHTQTSPMTNLGQFQNGLNGFGSMQAMQSMPNLNMMNMNGYGMHQPMQYPYNNQNMNMSNMGLGMNNMGMDLNYNPMMLAGQMQMPVGMGMNMNMGGMGMPMGMPVGYGMPTNMAAYDAIGMGPPLTNQQRSTIDRWRQGIA